MSKHEGYIRFKIDDSLRFDMSGEQAMSLLNQIANPIDNVFDDGSVQDVDEGAARTIWFNRTVLSLTPIQVELLQSELERVLDKQGFADHLKDRFCGPDDWIEGGF